MRKKGNAGIRTAVFLIMCPLLFLTGCQSRTDGAQVTGIQIDKNGGVTHTIVEAFDKEYYTQEGLESMIQEEISAYNAEYPQAVALQSIALSGPEEENVVVTMKYASCEDYRRFNGEELFFGTVAEAKLAGYALDVELVGSSDSTLRLDKAGLEGLTEGRLLIVGGDIQVSLPGKVLYMTDGTELVNNKCIHARKADGLTYVTIK